MLTDIRIFGEYKKFSILFSSKRDAIAICSACAYNVDFIDVLPEIIIDIEQGGGDPFTFKCGDGCRYGHIFSSDLFWIVLKNLLIDLFIYNMMAFN